ncbi:13816_t:CDS:2 [Rhizophagus irregularis]|nr:13816_t:CDS:2 [Rhizophagus irregularis]
MEIYRFKNQNVDEFVVGFAAAAVVSARFVVRQTQTFMLGSKCIYCYKYFSLPIELTRSFNERLKTESDVENEFDLPPVDEIPLEQAEKHPNVAETGIASVYNVSGWDENEARKAFSMTNIQYSYGGSDNWVNGKKRSLNILTILMALILR